MNDRPAAQSRADDQLAQLLEQFAQRYRAGERPTVDEYARRHPELADQIRELFPAVIALESPGGAVTSDVGPAWERVGSTIGRYKLLERIGEGGFGVVYMAEQLTPVRRKVALKVIKPGVDTRQVIARFEAERQALALMDHENIAKVLDAGATDSGRPYFVMELVHGVPITEYCDRAELPPRERLELFVQVCRAVQHAHTKGIIHRDIKPTNVLVTLHEGVAVPKVIDFGVAKATGQQLTEKTLFTNFAQMVGTPLYMSPEQAEMSSMDVDTRSDVYSLGVLLYELLTGTTPLDKDRLKRAAFDEIRRIIREEDPPRPSTRLSTLGDQAKTVSARRKSDPAQLGRLVRGELDWIVMKALEKDRNRRYETANGLARDIERYLHDEPVQACPPSASYRLRKFARRNKPLLMMSSFAAAALILATLVSTWQAIRATEARELAQLRLAETEQQRREVERNFQRACDAVDQLLLHVAQQSLAHVPQMEEVRRTLLHKALDFYKQFLEERSDDPVVRRQAARVYRNVAGIHRMLGDQRSAEQAWRESIVLLEGLVRDWPDDAESRRELARSHSGLGELLRDENRREEAEAEYAAAIPVLEQLVADHPDEPDPRSDLAHAYHNFAALLRTLQRQTQAEEMFRKAIELREHLVEDFADVPEHAQELARSHFSHALLLAETKRDAEAEEAHRRAIELSSGLAQRYPDMVDSRNIHSTSLTFLGNMLRRAKRFDEAEEAYEQSVTIATALVRDFPKVISYRRQLAADHFYLGALERARGRTEQAVGQYQTALDQYEKLLVEAPAVPAHLKELIDCHNQLIEVLTAAGRHDEVAQTRQRVDETLQQLMTQQPQLLSSRQQLAEEYRSLASRLRTAKRWEDAERAAEQAIEAAEKLVAEQPGSVESQQLLGLCLRERGAIYRESNRNDEAEKDFRRSADILTRLASSFPEAPEYRAQLGQTLLNLGLLLRLTGRAQEAEPVYHEAVRLRPDDPEAHNGLGNALWWQGRRAEAEAPYREALRLKPEFTGCRFNLAMILTQQGKLAEAEVEFREILRLMPEDAHTYNELAWHLATFPDHSQRKPQAAAELAAKAVSLRPLHYQYRNTLTIALSRAGDDAGAIASAKRSLQLFGADCDDFYVLATAHARQKEPERAFAWLVAGDQRLARFVQDGQRAVELRNAALGALQEAGLAQPLPVVQHDILRQRYDEWIEREPQAAFAYQLRAQIHADTGDRDRAEADYKRAFELLASEREISLDDPQQVYDFAAESLQFRRWELVVAGYGRVIELRDQNKRPRGDRFWTDVRPHQERGFAYGWLGDRTKAAAEYSIAIDLSPETGDLWARRGEIHLSLGQLDKALADYTKALELTPQHPSGWPWDNYASVLVQLGNWPQASAKLKALAQSQPENIRLAYEYALVLLGAGDVAGYREACREMLQRFGESSDSAAAHWVAWSCALRADALDDLAPAVALAEKAASAEPQNLQYKVSLGAILYRAGRLEQAARVLEEVEAQLAEQAEAAPSSPAYAWFVLAMAHHRLGNSDEAQRWQSRANEYTEQVLTAQPSNETRAIWNRVLTLRLLRDEMNDLMATPGLSLKVERAID